MSVADPGFLGGGAPTPLVGGGGGGVGWVGQYTILPNFPKKLHEIERIWTPGRGRGTLAPLRSGNTF